MDHGRLVFSFRVTFLVAILTMMLLIVLISFTFVVVDLIGSICARVNSVVLFYSLCYGDVIIS